MIFFGCFFVLIKVNYGKFFLGVINVFFIFVDWRVNFIYEKSY